MAEAGASKDEIADGVHYVNDYCSKKHRGVVRCAWTCNKGRIIESQRAFKKGEIIFREPPLHIVAEQQGDELFDRLVQLCRENPQVFEYEILWYWTALSSLKPSQVGPLKGLLVPISDDQQRRLLLLYHRHDTAASEATKLLVKEFELAPQVDPLELEQLLQVWILNCFEHSESPLGYSAYFLSSFMSHSCFPTAVWHYEGDDFVLRARCDIEENDEVTVSYLSEDALLESVSSRRKHLKESKHFYCECPRCADSADKARGFRCPQCRGSVFPNPQLGEEDNAPQPVCIRCKREFDPAEVRHCVDLEHRTQEQILRWEQELDNNMGPSHLASHRKMIEQAIREADVHLRQHWLLDKGWYLLAHLYENAKLYQEAEEVMQRRIQFQECAYPGLNGKHAWTLESFGDMLLRHRGAKVNPRVQVRDETTAQALARQAPQMYAQSLRILKLMFGEHHDYFTSVRRKSDELSFELDRLLGTAGDVPWGSIQSL